jgi:hypothetical protein
VTAGKVFSTQIVSLWYPVPRHQLCHPDQQTRPRTCHETELDLRNAGNQAERDVRPAKTQQKISGRLRSEQATRHRYAVRGYISTAAKHGIGVFTACATRSPETPGCRPSRPAPEIRPQAITPRDESERSA